MCLGQLDLDCQRIIKALKQYIHILVHTTTRSGTSYFIFHTATTRLVLNFDPKLHFHPALMLLKIVVIFATKRD